MKSANALLTAVSKEWPTVRADAITAIERHDTASRPVRMLRAPRVLVIEDEPSVASYIADVVRECGCIPVVVKTLEDAAAALGKDQFSRAVVDWRLPDGFGTIKHAGLLVEVLREAGVDRLIYSGYVDDIPEATKAHTPVLEKGVGSFPALRRWLIGERQ